MQRRMIVRGQLHQVDCAGREDGSSPAGLFLDALKIGAWDQAEADGPMDEQIGDYHWFLNAIRHWANTGEPVYPHAAGGYTAKLPIDDYADAEAPESQFWQIPYFDPLIRLGHAFTKSSQKTSSKDIVASKEVRTEDLAHDREANPA